MAAESPAAIRRPVHDQCAPAPSGRGAGGWGLPLALPVALGLSYVALFLTVDGLRIFAVAVCAFYVLALAQTAHILLPPRPAPAASQV